MESLRAAAVVLAVALLATGCSQDTQAPAAGRTTTPQAVIIGPAPAPAVIVDAPVDEVWGLAQLVPPDGFAVSSSLRRPDPDGLPSYLLVGSTTAEGAAMLCDQLGGLVPVPPGELPEADLPGWGLTAPPEGELGRCSAPEPVVPSLQRDVLVAVTGATVTVWVSAYDTPVSS